jgi:hypothetical protein
VFACVQEQQFTCDILDSLSMSVLTLHEKSSTNDFDFAAPCPRIFPFPQQTMPLNGCLESCAAESALQSRR